ncbi:hypothetical protein [Pseudomonas aeruginosa]|uniref:hypothetical protein n=1 Tax=Pseudomonas aeruginosa TaxID=287 RepID=UPI00191701B9|nr:hypothetical protein [Pseudomonas aeruginosa]EKW4642237.1 hypothetical protein [Pseudomonas aeruginosa]MBH4232787.1 hypothetical protein [Pseudomonas aeruginosa]MCP9251876.1 hypothetical protein [Pseudomonas aeruginosa]MDG3922781.1 hypothetical protein [Pseudomonas aeruginosa]MDG4011332.1 hypothetical protein [Pseudomonas aeruginosa]
MSPKTEQDSRPIAEAWRNRDTQKALDGYLSAGIAQLEQERDAALANVDALAVQVLKLGGTISFAHHRTDQAGQVPQAWLDVQAERLRQVEDEGWTPEHDDEHDSGEIACAAACYALPPAHPARIEGALGRYGRDPNIWPWTRDWWKPAPNDRRRELIKAGALVLAEIERLDRAAASQGGPSDA